MRRRISSSLSALALLGAGLALLLTVRAAAWSALVVAAALLGALAPGLLALDLATEAVVGAAVVAGHRRLRPALAGADVAEIRLLGRLVVRRADGTVVQDAEWRGAKNLDLLRLLALAGGRLRAGEAVAALWPDAEPRRAAASLRTAVFELRRLLGPGHVQRSGEDLVLCETWVDVDAYRTLAVQARHAAADGLAASCLDLARQAAALHLGPVAPRASDGVLVSEHVAALEGLRRDAVLDAGQAALLVGRARQTVALLTAYLAEDPLCERAYRGVMEAQAALGETGQALATYDACRRVLADELGVDPSPLTSGLYLRLLAGPAVAPHEPVDDPGTGPGDAVAVLRSLHADLPPAWLDAFHLLAVATSPVPSAALAALVGVDEAQAATGRLGDLGLLERTTDGTLRLADPWLVRAARDWLRPRRRDALAKQVSAALRAPGPAAPVRPGGPEAFAAAALAAALGGDPDEAEDLLDRYEAALGARGEQPAERVWRLVVTAAVRDARGRDGSATRALAEQVARTAGLATHPALAVPARPSAPALVAARPA